MKDLDLNIPEAYDFYKKYLLDLTADKTALFRKYGFRTTGSISPYDWELFGAILLRDRANQSGYGADLENYEIKSAISGNSFEYQYHRNRGEEKLRDEAKVDHVFFSYEPDYKGVEVRLVNGQLLQPLFDSWLAGLKANYGGANPRQRFRKSVSYGFVLINGVLLLRIQDGELG